MPAPRQPRSAVLIVPSPALTLLLAMLIDALAGDPPRLYARIPHPVALLGRWIAWLDEHLNVAPRAAGQLPALRLRGAAVTLTVVSAAALAGIAVHALAGQFPYGWLAESVLASTLLAARSLHDHVARVAQALPFGADAAREPISHLVGRDPASLDAHGIARAAIESGAENFVDGYVAPAFWFAVLGMPGLAAYKAINTGGRRASVP